MIDSIQHVIYRVFVQASRWELWLSGVRATMTIAFFALLLGIALGLAIALIRVVHDSAAKPHILVRIPNRIVKTYVSIIRGTPLVIQLLIMNFAILAASRNGILIGSLAFGLNSGAYLSEVFRGGILSVDKGQMEAGRSLGLSYPQTMRKIILPQAIKNSLPALGNEFISLFKDTSIAGMAAITDVTHAGNIIRNLTFNPAPLFFVAAFYLVVVLILEFLVGILERRLRKSDQR
ncbi:MAG: amino acid ABC transporter permease [Oscillospiraceae bacterium]|nr:amino acid ABC transporter permease [Oscillospiraceae bacterium]